MKIDVLFFGAAHDLTGITQERVELGDGECLDDLWRRYTQRFPRLAELAGRLAAAVNQEVVDRAHRLKDGDEVAFLPPVSGGTNAAGARAQPSALPRDYFQITREVIRAEELARKMPGDGALVTFEGIVRDNSKGRRTLYLEYEAYEPMALAKMAEITGQARAKFPIDSVAMVHRMGRLEIGETSVAIVVTAAHRGAAFDACRFLIDHLKQTVPIWKKEFFEDGGVWAEGETLASRRKSKFETRQKITGARAGTRPMTR